MKMLWLCKLGWHNWKYYFYLFDYYPAERTCRDCRKFQTQDLDGSFSDDFPNTKRGSGYY